MAAGNTPPLGLKISIEARGVDDETKERFTTSAMSSVQVFAGLAGEYGVELPELVLIGTSDFRETVDALLKEVHGPASGDYTTERLGGEAIGKNIPLDEVHSRVAIVMLSHMWAPAAGAAGLAGGHYFLAHELTHAVLDRVRIASGALDGVIFPSQTPVAVARSITRSAVDESRADKVADVVLSHSATKTVDGEQAPLHITDPGMMSPVAYRDRLAELLTSAVYPGWHDLVNRYRNRRCTLEELMLQLFQETDQVMTTFGHSEGERQCTPDSPDLILPPAQGEPGAEWLIGPVWEAVMDVATSHPSMPSVSDFKTAEFAILDAGERELFAMWERLGITFDPPRPAAHPFEIKVREPGQPPAPFSQS